MSTNKPRFTITVSNDTLSEIVAFQQQNNLATRSNAIQQLIRIGIADLKKGQQTNKKSPALSDEAQTLAKDYDVLDDYGKRVVRTVADMELDRVHASLSPKIKDEQVG